MIAALRPQSTRSTPSRHPLQRLQRVQPRKIALIEPGPSISAPAPASLCAHLCTSVVKNFRPTRYPLLATRYFLPVPSISHLRSPPPPPSLSAPRALRVKPFFPFGASLRPDLRTSISDLRSPETSGLLATHYSLLSPRPLRSPNFDLRPRPRLDLCRFVSIRG